jgi:hypothetical protein
MLTVNMIGCLGTISILVIFSELKSEPLLWTMTASYGLFMASVFATAYTLPQDLGVELNSTASAILIGILYCGISALFNIITEILLFSIS